MVLENCNITNSAHKFITRVCDLCSKQEIVRMNSIYRGRLRRGTRRDLCKICCNLSSEKESSAWAVGEKSPNWNGGIQKRCDGGYIKHFGGGRKKELHRYIFEQHIGRELTDIEIIHHIDLNRGNNKLSNLWLFPSEKEHKLAHHQLERLGFSLLNKLIWYDFGNKEYTLLRQTTKVGGIVYPTQNLWKRSIVRQYGIKEYWCYKIGSSEKKSHHVFVAEHFLGRKLFRDENVHHVNNNSLDNDWANLDIMSKKEHGKAHFSLQDCVSQFVKSGIVDFKNGMYYKKDKNA